MSLAGKRVLLTGGSGFLGPYVLRGLQAAGVAEIISPRRADADLTLQSESERLVGASDPQIVIHLAAEVGGIGANIKHPGRFFYANMAMGLHLVEACRVAGVEKFVQIGTVCAYPKITPVPFREEDLWAGYPEETNAQYGIAKKALLVMLDGYRKEYGFNGIYLLPTNLYGPGDNFDPETSHVIPAMIRKFVEARDSNEPEVEMWGTGSPSREFLFVQDAARAIVMATERYDGPEPVNLGTGHSERSIRSLAKTIAQLTKFRGSIKWDASKPDGQPRRSLSTDRAREYFGFEARVGLEDGLRQTIDWWERTRAERD